MENYEFVCQIGKGNFGRISKIIRKSDHKTLIWKELDYGQMSEKEKEQIVNEVNILRELKHPNIVKYYDRIIDKKHSKIYIIMEYCEGGDLNQLIKRCKKNNEHIAEDIIWKIYTQVLLAIHIIHNHKKGKILHRDIKPSNIFLDKDNNVKLGDFGLSRELSNESNFAYSHVGTPYYMSPEQIDETKYNEKSDIWSLGCFLYELTTFHPPFEAKNQIMLAMKIKSGKVEKINKKYSEELWRVINWMLTVDYNERPSSEELLNIPQVSIRLREKRVKDTINKLRIFEEKLNNKDNEQKEKEENLIKKENELIDKENYLIKKEKEILEKEKEIEEKEKSLYELEKKIKNLSMSSGTAYTSSKFQSNLSNFGSEINNNNVIISSNNNYFNDSNNNELFSNNKNTFSNKNIINNDLNSLIMYSAKMNNKDNVQNTNSNVENNNVKKISANTNTSINNINKKNNIYLISNNNNEYEDQISQQSSNIDFINNYNNMSKNHRRLHYSSTNIYSNYLDNNYKISNNNEVQKKNSSNLNRSNISNDSSNNKYLINSFAKINNNNSILEDNIKKYNNLINNNKMYYDTKNPSNPFIMKPEENHNKSLYNIKTSKNNNNITFSDISNKSNNKLNNDDYNNIIPRLNNYDNENKQNISLYKNIQNNLINNYNTDNNNLFNYKNNISEYNNYNTNRRPSTHYGITNSSNNIDISDSINSVRCIKRVKTPKLQKISARRSDNNRINENYGINNYIRSNTNNCNNNDTSNIARKMSQRNIGVGNNMSYKNNNTVNNSFRNRSEMLINYNKKKKN